LLASGPKPGASTNFAILATERRALHAALVIWLDFIDERGSLGAHSLQKCKREILTDSYRVVCNCRRPADFPWFPAVTTRESAHSAPRQIGCVHN
jgi:hypothetical protein